MADEPGHSHLLNFPEALEALFSRLGELKVVLGPAAAPGVDQVEADLRSALAARGRGAVPAAVERIRAALGRLAAFAAAGRPAGGASRRGLGARVRQAVRAGAPGPARTA